VRNRVKYHLKFQVTSFIFHVSICGNAAAVVRVWDELTAAAATQVDCTYNIFFSNFKIQIGQFALNSHTNGIANVVVAHAVAQVGAHEVGASFSLRLLKLRLGAKDAAWLRRVVCAIVHMTMRILAAIMQTPRTKTSTTFAARERKAVDEIDKHLLATRTSQAQQIVGDVTTMRCNLFVARHFASQSTLLHRQIGLMTLLLFDEHTIL
jgi:hypothetical protein